MKREYLTHSVRDGNEIYCLYLFRSETDEFDSFEINVYGDIFIIGRSFPSNSTMAASNDPLCLA